MSKDNKDDLENLGMQSNEELFPSLALIDLLNSSGSSGSVDLGPIFPPTADQTTNVLDFFIDDSSNKAKSLFDLQLYEKALAQAIVEANQSSTTIPPFGRVAEIIKMADELKDQQKKLVDEKKIGLEDEQDWAKKYYIAAAKIESKNIQMTNKVCSYLSDQYYYQDAFPFFTDVTDARNLQSVNYWEIKANVLANLGKCEKAQECFTWAMCLYGGESPPTLLYNLGYVYGLLGEAVQDFWYQEVKNSYYKKKDLNSSLAWGYVLLSPESEVGNRQMAYAYFEEKVTEFPQNSHFLIGKMLAVVSNLRHGYIVDSKMEKDFVTNIYYLLKEFPRNLKLLTAHAEYLCFKKEFLKAKTLYLKALKISPEYIEALNGLGNLYLKAKEYKEAQFQFEKVLENCPENETAKKGKQEAILAQSTRVPPVPKFTSSGSSSSSSSSKLSEAKCTLFNSYTEDEVQVIERPTSSSRSKVSKSKKRKPVDKNEGSSKAKKLR